MGFTLMGAGRTGMRAHLGGQVAEKSDLGHTIHPAVDLRVCF
jgi:hypothetical protein